MGKRLIVLLGPTGVGKTELSIEIARHFHTSIISCDSRQIYREMRIGTAVPSREQLSAVPHFFIHTLSVKDYYNSWQFEQQALDKIRELHHTAEVVLLVGGSMMYIDALCKGIDDIPTIDPELREQLMNRMEVEGVEAIRDLLKKLDPVFYAQVDLNNAKRVLHAVEVCMMAGKPYSSLRTNQPKKREFDILKIGLNREKTELYDRIDKRVDIMLEEGLEGEARSLYPLRHLNPLNTVGYKEFFEYFDNKIDYEEAVRLIKRNSRRYAKKQLSWFRRDTAIHWFHPDDKENIFRWIEGKGEN
ncbi:tRNA dimethylallyltransferase 1 [Odoribacter laneus]|jgi:tRNA dimethylallyltransferase|uniref:tRNA dimethylallyltransferase n=1 Tax=Odoribacter laneus YIT 12061 TaxID=742817 RepID=H1DFY8_9BACT|nr:tRNA (adenosine(37)-N6)-dimethylallyltransferase MiaA [Odoribacter laneus]EHP48811.1 tRNA dimethylallyltransferase [Odoribacter laneus YIT 12061]GKI23453.1 tRNA dimethylallyltransferase 1 [Odoribacter laneus]GKI24270.1 tRNA dimethylallyltransferase 1 [Odoribacter laneus]CCZ80783.1 tRNA dimethylallyltransferase 1 [Odoribacter laneus CAG:561]